MSNKDSREFVGLFQYNIIKNLKKKFNIIKKWKVEKYS